MVPQAVISYAFHGFQLSQSQLIIFFNLKYTSVYEFEGSPLPPEFNL